MLPGNSFLLSCSFSIIILSDEPIYNKLFLTYGTEFVLIFSGADKFCLAHALRQLTRDVKSNIRKLNSSSDVIFSPPRETPNDVRKKVVMRRKMSKLKEMTNVK